MENKKVNSKFIYINLFVCGSRQNTRIGGRPVMRDREMATEGLGRPEEEFGVGVGVARCPVNKLELEVGIRLARCSNGPV